MSKWIKFCKIILKYGQICKIAKNGANSVKLCKKNYVVEIKLNLPNYTWK